MEKQKIALWCGLALLPFLTFAQEINTGSGRIGFEFGSDNYFGGINVPERVRASKSVYEYNDFYYGSPKANQSITTLYGGVNYETYFNNDRLGFSAGLRFSQFTSEISAGWNQNYLVWLFRQDETYTDFLTIRSITQNNNYLGVPLSLRYILPRKRDSFFTQYFKLGTAINYCLSTNNSILFFDASMSRHEDAVSEQIGKPNPLNALIYPAYGFKFGRMKNVWVNLEFIFPGFIIGNNAHPFVKTNVGMGIQLAVQIPLK